MDHLRDQEKLFSQFAFSMSWKALIDERQLQEEKLLKRHAVALTNAYVFFDVGSRAQRM